MRQQGIFLHKMIMFILLFCSADTLVFGSTADDRFILVRYVMEGMIMLWMLGYTVYKNKIPFDIREKCLISMIFFVLCTCIFNRDLRFGYIYIIMLLTLGWSFSVYISFEEFTGFFCEFMKVFSVISLAFFGLYVGVHQVMEIFPVITNSAGREHYTILLSSMPVEFYLDEYRNAGFFREPGVFQMYLIWAIMFEIFVKKKMSIVNCLIFLVTIITTFSTTAYIAVAMILVIYFIKKGDRRDVLIKRCLLAAGSLLLLGTVLFTDILSPDGIIFRKFTEANNPSVSARVASLIVNMIMTARNPLFGNGLTFTNEQYSNYAMKYLHLEVSDNTTMLLYMMATLGILFTLLFVAGIWQFCKKMAKSTVLQLGLVSIFLVLFVGENLIFSPITYIFVFYGLAEWNRMVKKHENIDDKQYL